MNRKIIAYTIGAIGLLFSLYLVFGIEAYFKVDNVSMTRGDFRGLLFQAFTRGVLTAIPCILFLIINLKRAAQNKSAI